jgi:tetratricopeptide (TPR) repeat protein
MGIVYEARDVRLGRTVALKMLLKEKELTQVTLKRFEREARSAGKLRHPNVCAIHETGAVDGTPYFTMDLIRGDSLTGMIEKARGAIPWRTTATVIRDAARGLAHAHEQGLIHRDLKPSNVLVDEEGRGHLVDFGLARETENTADRLTRSGMVVGTPLYLAPEHIARAEIGPPADIYALGATLYEALSGDPPFKKETVFALFEAIQKGNPPPPPLPAGAPADLGRIALRALAREPARRYLTATAMADDLDRVLGGKPIVGRRSTASEIARAHPRALGAAGLVLLAGPIALAAALWGPETRPAAKLAPPPPPPPAPAHAEPEKPAPPAFVVTAATPEAAIDQGRARLWAGDLEAARACYRKALNLAPRQLDALLEEALTGVLLEDPAATAAASDVILKHAQHPVASVLLETFSTEEFHFDIGGTASYEGLRGSPLSPILRAVHLRLRTESRPTTELLREVLDERPRCGLLAIDLATALLRDGKPEAAAALLDEDRTYEGVSAFQREWARARTLVALGHGDAADACLAKIQAPPHLVVRARGRRAAHAIARGDLAAAAALYAKDEPGSIEDRLALARALAGLGRKAEARRVADRALEIAEQGGDRVGILRAAGASPNDVRSALAETDGIALARNASLLAFAVRGFRARLAAREGDRTTAKADLEHFPEDSGEALATQGTIALLEGALPAAVKTFERAFAAKDPPGADALLDCATALERTGDVRGALAALRLAVKSDPTVGPQAKDAVERLEKVPVDALPDEVLLDVTPDEACMVGGKDGRGPWLLTDDKYTPRQETIHGFAPVVEIPLRAAGRKVVFEATCDDPIGLEILPGVIALTDHGWWNTGHAALVSTRATLFSRVEWIAAPGTYTFLVARYLPPGTPPRAVKIRRVTVTLSR